MHATWYLDSQLLEDADGSIDIAARLGDRASRWIGGVLHHPDPAAHLRWVSGVLERYPQAAPTAKVTTSNQVTLLWLHLPGPVSVDGPETLE